MSISSEYTGVTTALGGRNSWSCYGGSRLLLANSKTGTYKKFDCTQKQTIKFSTKLSQLDCGVVAAFYMVAMESINNNDYSGTLYNDAQGVGLLSSSSTLLEKKGRSEIDLLEASSRSAQTTLHGYGNGTGGRWVNGIDMNGIWDNANVDNLGNFIQKFGNSNDNPSTINTDKSIDVSCNITPTLADSSDNYYIKIETTIKQDDKILTLIVDSSIPNNTLQQMNSTTFPGSELKNMCFIYSLWTDYEGGGHNPAYWLDGDTSFDGSYSSGKGNKRGSCTKDDYTISSNIQKNINSNSNDCATDITYFNMIYDLSFSGLRDDELEDYAWILDYMYRGINKPGDSNYNPTMQGSWVGRYNYSYLNCQTTPDTVLSKQKINPADTKFTYPNSKICSTLFNNGLDNVNEQVNSCVFDGRESCQILNTRLKKFDAPAPAPAPTPAPAPAPAPTPTPAPAPASTNPIFIIIIILAIVLLILIAVFLTKRFIK